MSSSLHRDADLWSMDLLQGQASHSISQCSVEEQN